MTRSEPGEALVSAPSMCVFCTDGVDTGSGRPVCPGCESRFDVLSNGVLSCRGAGGKVEYPEAGNELTRRVEDVSFWFAHRDRILRGLLNQYPPDGTLWDIGGGNGYQARRWEDAGHPVVMVEPGPVGCANARDRGLSVVVQASLEDLGLPDASVAAVSFLDVLEHLENPRTILDETARVLRPGGRVYVTVPAFSLLWSDEDDYALHKRRYTAQTLTRELEVVGLNVEFLSYYFQFLILPIFLLRTLPSWMAGSRGAAPREMDPSDHDADGLKGRFLQWFLDREYEQFARGSRLSFGSSLLCVAHFRGRGGG